MRRADLFKGNPFRESLSNLAVRRPQLVMAAAHLFDGTRHLHGLTKTARPLLEIAAAFCDEELDAENNAAISRFSNSLKRRVPGLTAVQRGAVAEAVSLFQRRSVAPPFSAAIQGKTEDLARELAFRLAALLEVAEAVRKAAGPKPRIAGIGDDGEGLDVFVASPSEVKSPPAVSDLECRLWNAAMPRPVRSVRVAERRASIPGAMAPAESLGAAARRTILTQLEILTSRRHGLAFREDIEYVHEMRVALRYLRAALAVLGRALGGIPKEFVGRVKSFARALGAVRDCDVFVRALREEERRVPEECAPSVRALVRAEQSKRRRLYAGILDLFETDVYRILAEEDYALFRAPLKSPGGLKENRRARRKVRAAAPRKLSKHLRRLLAFRGGLHQLTEAEQHALRIECKKMRYTAAFFAPIYPTRLRRIIQPMTRMQDLLGEANDVVVYRDRILRHYDALRTSSSRHTHTAARDALLRRLEERRANALAEAALVWDRFRNKRSLRTVQGAIRSPMA